MSYYPDDSYGPNGPYDPNSPYESYGGLPHNNQLYNGQHESNGDYDDDYQSMTNSMARANLDDIRSWKDLKKSDKALYTAIIESTKKLKKLESKGKIRPFKPHFPKVKLDGSSSSDSAVGNTVIGGSSSSGSAADYTGSGSSSSAAQLADGWYTDPWMQQPGRDEQWSSDGQWTGYTP